MPRREITIACRGYNTSSVPPLRFPTMVRVAMSSIGAPIAIAVGPLDCQYYVDRQCNASPLIVSEYLACPYDFQFPIDVRMGTHSSSLGTLKNPIESLIDELMGIREDS